MPDLEARLRDIDRVPVPDLWPRIDSDHGDVVLVGRSRSRLLGAAAAALVAVAGIAYAIAAFVGTGAAPQTGTLPTPTVTKIRIPTGGARAVAIGERAVWVLAVGGVVPVDPVTGRVGNLVHVPRNVDAVATGGGSVWVARYPNVRDPSTVPGSVVRIDERTSRVVANIPVGAAPQGVLYAYGSVWVANTDDGTVSRIDPDTNRVVATIPTGGGPRGMAAGFGKVWVLNEYGNTSIVRIDPASTGFVGALPGSLYVDIGNGTVWLQHLDGLQQFDPVADRFVGTPDRFQSGPPILGEGTMWILERLVPTPAEQRRLQGVPGAITGGENVVYRLDPTTFQLLTRPVEIGAVEVGKPAIGFGSVWFPRNHQLLRIDSHAGRSPSGISAFYSDAHAAASALQRAGLCTDFQEGAQRFPFPSESVGRCTIEGARVTVRVYTDPVWLERALRTRPLGTVMVVGPNWFVATGSRSIASTIEQAIGGTLRNP